MSKKFTKQEKAWADGVLHGYVKAVERGDQTAAINTGGGIAPSSAFLDILKARVIEGQTLSKEDLLNAKNTLSASEQAELKTLLDSR
jgi:hypothetical protein